jgi:hypothetical protein
MKMFFNITYFLDMGSTVTIYALVTWRLFVHILNYMELIDPNWIENKDKITLDEKNVGQVFYRRIFFTVLFIVTIPLFLKKSMNSLSFISILYLGILITLVLFIFLFLYPYYEHFLKINP